jgi:sigma-54-interacting transcriptional regulator
MARLWDFSAARAITIGVRPDDWRLLVTVRPNVLLEGAHEIIDIVIGEAMECLPTPHATWCGAPPRGDRPATLVVRSISALDCDQQRSLCEWLDAPGDRVQVISTTSEPLYPMVGRGAFLESLYYRLNVMRLDIAIAQDGPDATRTACGESPA